MQLDGKTALVTGGSRGIGRAICLELASQGANVALLYAGNSAAAADTTAQVEAMGRKALALQCDVACPTAVAAAVAAVLEAFTEVDILVNNAGIVRDKLVLAMSAEDFDAVVDTSLKGAFNMTKQLYQHFMRRRSGRIINISSVVGLHGNAGQANYAAAKAGLIGFTKSTAQELAARGVTCNAIAPGFIVSDMTDTLPEKTRQIIQDSIPARRLGTPEDVAHLAAFLASDAAAYITGEVIRVDGGMAM